MRHQAASREKGDERVAVCPRRQSHVHPLSHRRSCRRHPRAGCRHHCPPTRRAAPHPSRRRRPNRHRAHRTRRHHRRQFRSEEHTSELQSLMRISYAVFCLKKKKKKIKRKYTSPTNNNSTVITIHTPNTTTRHSS